MKKFAIAAFLAAMIVSPAIARPMIAHAAAPSADVYYGNRYVGSDPDVHVREDLLREAPAYLGDS